MWLLIKQTCMPKSTVSITFAAVFNQRNFAKPSGIFSGTEQLEVLSMDIYSDLVGS